MTRRSILVVEDQAHLAYGHYPKGFTDLTRALTQLGCDVRVLTSRGWVGGDGREQGIRVERFGWLTAALWSIADALQPSRTRKDWPRGVRWSAYAAATMRASSIALATRRALRRSPSPAPDAILFHHDVHTFVLAALVGPGRFVHHAFRSPPGDRPRTMAGRLLDREVRRQEARRRREAGGFRVVAATPALVDAWTRRAPYLDPVEIVHGMSADEQPLDDARRVFGIADDARVALVFGADHGNKDLDTVWRAFGTLPEWTLLVVGSVADAYGTWSATHGAVDGAVVVGGYVDYETRARAYSAADVVVISFEPGHVRDSGVLQDALAFGRPAVCSSGTDSANRVTEFGLGRVFEPGDADALAAAVRAGPWRPLSSEVVERARERTSAASVARAHLDALDALGGARGADGADARGAPDQTGRK